MTMDAVTIETLPTTKSLLSTNVPDSTDIAKEKDDDILFLDEIDEDDEIRLRLSDDEEIEQENTLEHTENQHANLQLKKNDIEFDVHIAVTSKETSKSHSELKISQDLPEKISTNFIKNQSIKNSQSKKLTNEIENINDEESTMSGNDRVPPLTQNSRKFWSNNFDKRWKGINSPRGRPNFSHRNSNDWYNQQYSDQDKFNNRNNFNHHNNHFNKLRHNIRGGYSNKSVDFRNKEIRKEEADESVKLKHNILSSENVNDKSNSIQENGISNSIQTRKNDSSVKNDKSVIANVIKNDKEMKVIGKELNHKNSAQITSEVNLNVETCKENGNIGDILKDNDVKSVEKSMNKKLNDNGNLSTTKDCNVLMIESEKENCDSESEEVMKEESKCNTEIGEIEIGSDTSFILNGVELEFETNSIEKNSGLSSELKMFKVNGVADQLENLMEVDMNNQDLCNNIFKNGNSDQISECVNAKDIVLELSENYNKNLSETCEIELEADNISTFNDEQTSEAVEMSENANDSLDDKLISQMEISESEQNDSASSQTTNINENVETESSSDLISTIGAKDSDSNCFVRNENNSSKSSSSDNINNGDVKNNVTFKKETKHVKSEENNVKTAEGEKSKSNETEEEEKISSVIEEVDLVDDEAETGATTHTPNEVETDAPKTTDDVANGTTTGNKDTSQIVPINTADGSKVEESNEDGRAVVHKRRRRKRLSNIAYLEIASNEVQTDEFFNSVKMLIENGVRQKRRSARNAEEMIRKEILKNDEEDEDSSDESGKLIPVNYKKNNYTQSLSPPSLKRTLDETDRISDSVTLKRIKSSGDNPSTTSQSNESKEYIPKSKESITEINGFVRQISQEDIRGKLKKLKQEELEALLLQKIVECITIRGEMGKLREEARVSKRNQEATRTKCQQLQKQVEGFDMVLKRISYDKSSNNDKYAPPIKINRSVGLQVNFLSDHGIHNLKQIQAMKASGGNPSTGVAAKTTLTTTSASAGMVSTAQDNRSLTQSPRKMLKVRSPRRPETSSPTVTPGSPGGSSAISTSNGNNVSATNLVMSKPNDQNAKRAIALQNSNNLVQLMPTGPQQQAVAANPNISGATTRQANLAVQRPNSAVTNKTSDLIDLTDEEDKSKNSVVSPVTTGITTRFPRVLQAVPASVALNNQTNIRLLQGGNQGSQTAIVNNINTPRLAYVMQGGMTVPTRQLVLANNNAIRPVTSVSTRSIPTISYKQGLQTLTNGTVRVLTTQTSTTNLQHPAPLPESSIPESNPSWKSPPPAPSLKISKVPTGIVLSWNMSLSDKFAEIVSYQLYAYQEVAGTSPSASLWKKVGDVRALPLPMACTLTQFTEGNNYYFAVRAVDIHSRFGQYSKPGNISL